MARYLPAQHMSSRFCVLELYSASIANEQVS